MDTRKKADVQARAGAQQIWCKYNNVCSPSSQANARKMGGRTPFSNEPWATAAPKRSTIAYGRHQMEPRWQNRTAFKGTHAYDRHKIEPRRPNSLKGNLLSMGCQDNCGLQSQIKPGQAWLHSPQKRPASGGLGGHQGWSCRPNRPLLPSTGNHPRGIRNTIFSELKKKFSMVGKNALFQRSTDIDYPWGSVRLSSAQQPFHAKMHQISGRDQISLGNHSRVFGSGCSPRSYFKPGKTSYPLVHHKERGKVEINHGLQGTKFVFFAQAISARKLDRNFSCPKKGHVGMQNRPKACLFPSGPRRQIEKVCMHTNRGQNIPISGRLLWPKSPTPGVAKHHENIFKKWRAQGFLCWVYLDDILLVGASPNQVQKQVNSMVKDLQLSGMTINTKKSQLLPT